MYFSSPLSFFAYPISWDLSVSVTAAEEKYTSQTLAVSSRIHNVSNQLGSQCFGDSGREMYFSNPHSFFAYPQRLSTLAMEASGKLASRVFKSLVRQQKGQRERTVKVCEELQEMFRCVPSTIRYELQVRTLRHIQETYLELIEEHDKDDCLFVGTEIMIAVITQMATRIECTQEASTWHLGEALEHPEILDLYKDIGISGELVYNALPRLKKLEILRLGYGELHRPRTKITFSNNLVEFSARGYVNCEDIETLSNHCKLIKILKLDSIGERHVPYIARLEQLEELTMTYSHESHLAELLRLLAETERSDGTTIAYNLKKLHWDCILHYEQIELLLKHYPNLISLKLNLGDASITNNANALLKGLQNLKQLIVFNYDYSTLKLFLSDVGKNLCWLRLHEMMGNDILDFSRICPPTVKCLHLTYISPENLSSCEGARFPFVETLELSTVKYSAFEYMMSWFPNVRKLYVSNCVSDKVFETVILRIYMKDLQEAFFRCARRLVIVQFFMIWLLSLIIIY